MPTLTVWAGAFLLRETELAEADSSFFSGSLSFFSFLPFFRVEEIEISFRHHCQRWFESPQRAQSSFFIRASTRLLGMPLNASSFCSLVNLGVLFPAEDGAEVLGFFETGVFSSRASSAFPAPRLPFPPLPLAPESFSPTECPRRSSSFKNCSRARPISLMAWTNSSSSVGTPPLQVASCSRSLCGRPHFKSSCQVEPREPTFRFSDSIRSMYCSTLPAYFSRKSFWVLACFSKSTLYRSFMA